MRRLLRWLLVLVVLAALVPVAVIVGTNAFLNLSLPLIINRQPERLKMGWSWAWTWDLHQVRVWGYTLRVQGPLDQWWLSVDQALLSVDLRPLLDRRFHGDNIEAWGVSMAYRARMDAPPMPGRAPPTPYVEGRTAEVPGLLNPPDPRPEDIYGPPEAPWLIALDDANIEGIRELWLGDYRYVGNATVRGDLIVLPGSSLDLSDAELAIDGGEVQYEGVPLVGDLRAEGAFTLEGVDPTTEFGAAILAHLDAQVDLEARVDDLSWIDHFVGDSPWVGVEGGYGGLKAVLQVLQGTLQPGSFAYARAEDLAARVGTYRAGGEGAVLIEVLHHQEAALALVLDRFLIHRDGTGTPLVRGHGFRLDVHANALHLDAAPEGVRAVATLPRSDVPDLRAFQRYLPTDLGMKVQEGRATVSGRASIAEDGDQVSGSLSLDVPRVRVQWGSIPIVGKAHVEARVPSGRLDSGVYDIRGTRFELRDVSVGGRAPDWWARARIERGRVATSESDYVVADTSFAISDSSPVFGVAVGQRKVEPWIEKALTLRNLQGLANFRVGESSFDLRHMEVSTPKSEIHLHLKQTGTRTKALLFARFGGFTLATSVDGDEYALQTVDARKWFHARLAAAGTPEPMRKRDGSIVDADGKLDDTRPGLKVFGKDLGKLFGKKPKPDEGTKAQEEPKEKKGWPFGKKKPKDP